MQGNRTRGQARWQYKHGARRDPEYRIWMDMRNRCHNPNNHNWKNYGGRGIVIDPSWDDFIIFLKDMGRRPTPKHTLERTDNDGDYCRANCIWATGTQQRRNRSGVKLTMELARKARQQYAHGKTQTAIALDFGVDHTAIYKIVHNQIWREDHL